ncbi:hypothetical protein ACWD5R_23205 [Streptomyces sp. NPDC002514]|uniref:hypothetical protein n=1 Tax=Streptomyces sp. NPDC001270 TaxID=3364554 RepID=UPI00368F9959
MSPVGDEAVLRRSAPLDHATGEDGFPAGPPPASWCTTGHRFAQRTTADAWNVTDTAAAPSTADTGRDVWIAVDVHGTGARWFFNGTEAMRTSRLARSATGVEALVVNGATVSFDDLKVTELPAESHIRPWAPR